MNRAQKIQAAAAVTAVTLLAAGYAFVQHYNAKADAEEAAFLAGPKLDKAQLCKQCEDTKCSKLREACKSKECKDAYQCIQANRCGDPAQEEFSRCYCGDTEKTDCFMGGGTPKGACKELLEKAAKSTSPLEVGQKFYDMETDIGQAIQFANCRQSFCKDCN